MEQRRAASWTDARLSVGAQRRLPDFDYADPDAVVSITICTADRMPAFTDDTLCRIVVECIDWLRAHRGVRVYAYCLMPDHLHLVLQVDADGRSVSDIIASLKRFTARRRHELRRGGSLWQGRFYDHVLRRNEDVVTVARYVYANPVRAGLVASPEEYHWSGFPDPL